MKVKLLSQLNLPMELKLHRRNQVVITFFCLNAILGSRHRLANYFKTLTLILVFLSLLTFAARAQIEVARISFKNFKAVGFGGFLNFSLPASEANYVTIEGGLQYFKDRNDDDVAIIPALIGYRLTIDGTGTGLYLEPNAGYCFGSSSIQKNNGVSSLIVGSDGKPAVEKVAGPMAGLGVGYLLAPSGNIQFNIGIRYERTFGETATNIVAFRISHAFSFRRREE